MSSPPQPIHCEEEEKKSCDRGFLWALAGLPSSHLNTCARAWRGRGELTAGSAAGWFRLFFGCCWGADCRLNQEQSPTTAVSAHTNAVEPQRTTNCHVIGCVRGVRKAVGKCKNSGKCQTSLVLIRRLLPIGLQDLHGDRGLATSCRVNSRLHWGGLACSWAADGSHTAGSLSALADSSIH